MRDFTSTIYKKLIAELLHAGYGFTTFAEYIQAPDGKEKAIILRHDVDKKPLYSLRTAELENELGIKGTYYFRVAKNKLPKDVIERVAKLGHEIGYHYDDLNAVGGEIEKARESFHTNLAKLRELASVKTACMHGSPMSIYDNREMWKDRSYKEFGIVGEPYFDIDFKDVLYLTDTGRMWDGDKFSIRDRVSRNKLWVMDKREDRRKKTEDIELNKKSCRGNVYDPPVRNLHSTTDILHALEKDLLPDKIMLTLHPQRWTDRLIPWTVELLWQSMKNVVKYFVAAGRRP